MNGWRADYPYPYPYLTRMMMMMMMMVMAMMTVMGWGGGPYMGHWNGHMCPGNHMMPILHLPH